tara:strand:+ start:36244 stop:37167 length:924 start_codon:yes stop_codon:yes gene_type:complete
MPLYIDKINTKQASVEVKENKSLATEEERAKYSGIGHTHHAEHPECPSLIRAEIEEVWENKYGSSIVLGKDRPAGLASGRGGDGHTFCASIDIVAGRSGSPATKVNPNLDQDAARIMVVQRTDIDKNFKLAAGGILNTSGLSAIAMKSEAIRLVGSKGGIKLITSGVGEATKEGNLNQDKIGIEIIAANDDSSLQPMVKGDNLGVVIQDIYDKIDQVCAALENFRNHQMQFNTAVSVHEHRVPLPELPPTIQLQPLMGPLTSLAKNAFLHVSEPCRIIPFKNKISKGKYILDLENPLNIKSAYNKVN